MLFALLAEQPGVASPPPPPQSSDVAVVYRDGALSHSEVEAWLRFRPIRRRLPEGEARRQRIEERVLLSVLNGRFEDSGLASGRDYQSWLHQLQDRLAGAALRKDVVDASTATAAEVEAAFRARPHAFDSEKRFKLQNLYLEFPAGATESDRERLRGEMASLREQLLAGADFASLAKEKSQSATRSRGGFLGTVALGNLKPEIARVVSSLGSGELSLSIETADGLTLLKCLKILPAQVLSPKETRERLAVEIKNESFKRRWQALTSELLAAAKPEFRLPPATEPDKTIGILRSGGQREAISLRDLDFYLRDQRSAPARLLGDAELRRRFDEVVLRRVLTHEAERRGLTRDDAYRERMYFETLELRAELALEPEITAKLKPPSDPEVKAYYETRQDRFVDPERITLRSLKVPIRADLPATFYRQLQMSGGRLERGEIDLKALAAELGERAQLEDQVDLKPDQVFQLGRNIEFALRDLAPGSASGPHQEGRILWFVQLLARREERRLSFEEARKQIEVGLISGQRERIRADLRAALVAAQEIRINP